jgi:hypothetical protein
MRPEPTFAANPLDVESQSVVPIQAGARSVPVVFCIQMQRWLCGICVGVFLRFALLVAKYRSAPLRGTVVEPKGGGHYLRGISLCCTAAFEWPIAPIYVHRSGLRHPGLRAPWCFSSNFSVFLLQQPFKTGLRDHDQLYYCRFTLSTWITSTNT